MRLSGRKFLVAFLSSLNVKAFRLEHDNMSHSVLGTEKFPDKRFSLLFVFRLKAANNFPFLLGSLVSPEMKENILLLHLFMNSRH